MAPRADKVPCRRGRCRRVAVPKGRHEAGVQHVCGHLRVLNVVVWTSRHRLHRDAAAEGCARRDPLGAVSSAGTRGSGAAAPRRGAKGALQMRPVGGASPGPALPRKTGGEALTQEESTKLSSRGCRREGLGLRSTAGDGAISGLPALMPPLETVVAAATFARLGRALQKLSLLLRWMRTGWGPTALWLTPGATCQPIRGSVERCFGWVGLRCGACFSFSLARDPRGWD